MFKLATTFAGVIAVTQALDLNASSRWEDDDVKTVFDLSED